MQNISLKIKKIILLTGCVTTCAMSCIPGFAETRQERYLRRQRECNEKFMDGLEADGNLTQEAIDALGGPNCTRQPNHKSTSKSKSSKKQSTAQNSQSSSSTGKGWVYSTDELHVIGLPEGENGYTKPGYYGDIDGTYSGDGKGWVYSADELHVVGLPEGEDGYTKPGYYGDIPEK